MEENSKIEIFHKVCNSILKKELENGHLKWTHSEIARDSGVTRSLIYYYFGKEKHAILKVAYQFILESFFRIHPRSDKTLAERIKEVIHQIQQMPYLFVLYFLQKNVNTEFGLMISKAEKDFLKGLKSIYPELADHQILEIYLLELGAIAYSLSPQQSDRVFGRLDPK
jgi:AcrR family transcriptional regulator